MNIDSRNSAFPQYQYDDLPQYEYPDNPLGLRCEYPDDPPLRYEYADDLLASRDTPSPRHTLCEKIRETASFIFNRVWNHLSPPQTPLRNVSPPAYGSLDQYLPSAPPMLTEESVPPAYVPPLSTFFGDAPPAYDSLDQYLPSAPPMLTEESVPPAYEPPLELRIKTFVDQNNGLLYLGVFDDWRSKSFGTAINIFLDGSFLKWIAQLLGFGRDLNILENGEYKTYRVYKKSLVDHMSSIGFNDAYNGRLMSWSIVNSRDPTVLSYSTLFQHAFRDQTKGLQDVSVYDQLNEKQQKLLTDRLKVVAMNKDIDGVAALLSLGVPAI